MEKINLYCVKDKKGNYAFPFGQQNDLLALRAFEEALNSDGNALNKHPYDYELYKVGVFDDETAAISSHVEYMCSGKDYYKEKKNYGIDEILRALGREVETRLSKDN